MTVIIRVKAVMQASMLISRRPSMMAMRPPVEVPQIMSKKSQGLMVRPCRCEMWDMVCLRT